MHPWTKGDSGRRHIFSLPNRPSVFCIAQGHCLDMNASLSLFLVSVLQAITQMDPPWTA